MQNRVIDNNFYTAVFRELSNTAQLTPVSIEEQVDADGDVRLVAFFNPEGCITLDVSKLTPEIFGRSWFIPAYNERGVFFFGKALSPVIAEEILELSRSMMYKNTICHKHVRNYYGNLAEIIEKSMEFGNETVIKRFLR